jgi:hypothetical protein
MESFVVEAKFETEDKKLQARKEGLKSSSKNVCTDLICTEFKPQVKLPGACEEKHTRKRRAAERLLGAEAVVAQGISNTAVDTGADDAVVGVATRVGVLTYAKVSLPLLSRILHPPIICMA